MKRLGILFLSSVLLFTSCGPKISPAQQKKLDELSASIDSIATAVNQLDSAQLDIMLTDFFKKKYFVQNDMQDTLSRLVIYRLDSFVRLRKPMEFIKEQYSAIKQEANIMKQQMTDLNHDVENRLIEEKQFDRYFELEQDNHLQLRAAANQLVKVSNDALNSYNHHIPFVDSLINKYEKQIDE